MPLKHLSETRDVNDFFVALKRLDLINYHPSYSLEQIRSLGRDHGWLIEYCGPDTTPYKKHGQFVCKVIEKLSKNQMMLDPIDSSTLALNFDDSWVKKKELTKFMK